MRSKTAVSTALRQAQELIEHAERNDQRPDTVWLAQLGRAYASSVRAEMMDNARYFDKLHERADMDIEELSRSIARFGNHLDESRLSDADTIIEVDTPREVVPIEAEDDIRDTFSPEEQRSFIERCLKRLRP